MNLGKWEAWEDPTQDEIDIAEAKVYDSMIFLWERFRELSKLQEPGRMPGALLKVWAALSQHPSINTHMHAIDGGADVKINS